MYHVPKHDNHFREYSLGEYQKNKFLIGMGLMCLLNVPPVIAIDVGGHVGHYAYNMAKIFEKVLVFEPIDDNRKCLHENLKNFDNVEIFDFGLSNETKEIEMILEDGSNSGTWSGYGLYRAKGSNSITQRIRVKKFDDMFHGVLPNYIKIDVQGMEPEVIDGMKETLKLSDPVIQIEIVHGHEYGPRARTLMKSIGYEEIFNHSKERYFVSERTIRVNRKVVERIRSGKVDLVDLGGRFHEKTFT